MGNRKRFDLREIITMTFAIYIFVAPFILYEMGTFSFVTLPANILIMPFFPITMIFGFLTIFVGLLSNFLAVPFAYLSYFLLHYQLWVINFFANLPFATFTISKFSVISDTFNLRVFYLSAFWEKHFEVFQNITFSGVSRLASREFQKFLSFKNFVPEKVHI